MGGELKTATILPSQPSLTFKRFYGVLGVFALKLEKTNLIKLSYVIDEDTEVEKG